MSFQQNRNVIEWVLTVGAAIYLWVWWTWLYMSPGYYLFECLHVCNVLRIGRLYIGAEYLEKKGNMTGGEAKFTSLMMIVIGFVD